MGWLIDIIARILGYLHGKQDELRGITPKREETPAEAAPAPVAEEWDEPESLAGDMMEDTGGIELYTDCSYAWHKAANEVWPSMRPGIGIISSLVEARLRHAKEMDAAQFAYCIATVAHECGFRPRDEIRERKDSPRRANQDRYWLTNYYGRGLSQITWKTNYEKFGRLLGIPLAEEPELASGEEVGAEILVLGIDQGLFRRGHYIARYVNYGAAANDWTAARNVYNGDVRKNGPRIGKQAQALLEAWEQTESTYEV